MPRFPAKKHEKLGHLHSPSSHPASSESIGCSCILGFPRQQTADCFFLRLSVSRSVPRSRPRHPRRKPDAFPGPSQASTQQLRTSLPHQRNPPLPSLERPQKPPPPANTSSIAPPLSIARGCLSTPPLPSTTQGTWKPWLVCRRCPSIPACSSIESQDCHRTPTSRRPPRRSPPLYPALFRCCTRARADLRNAVDLPRHRLAVNAVFWVLLVRAPPRLILAPLPETRCHHLLAPKSPPSSRLTTGRRNPPNTIKNSQDGRQDGAVQIGGAGRRWCRQDGPHNPTLPATLC